MDHYYRETTGETPEGWFTYPELYREFVQKLPNDSVFVEVGSWKGKSMAFLGVEVINSGKSVRCYAVDTWEGSSEHTEDPWIKSNKLFHLFVSNTNKVSSVVIPIRLPSMEASKKFDSNSIDVVFIDACHDYGCVKEDIRAWLPKVKTGGIISGHDYYLPSVKKAVDEEFGQRAVVRSMQENCWIVTV